VDLPDDLFRALKARAALSGVTLRELTRSLIEQGLRSPVHGPLPGARRREPPPVIVPPRGRPIAAVPRSELARLEEEEAKHARSA
jgi:plasmid stability protein